MPSSTANALKFTGERFAPEVTGTIWYEHWHRYCAVQPIARGLRVLDAACGEGYGSSLLAATARDVVGIDVAAEAIAHAQARYGAPNARFVEASCTSLPIADGSVDLVVSFETIEHLAEQARMLAEFRRVLAPGGVLVISSPNKPVYSGGATVGNEFHVKELTRAELAELLEPEFPQQRWYAQQIVAQSALWAEPGDAPAPRAGALLCLADGVVGTAAEPAPPMYYVVVCAAAGVRLPELPELSLFDDGRQSLFTDYKRALLREKQLTWDELDARKIAEDRLAELIVAVNALASERERAAALEQALGRAEAELAGARTVLAATEAGLAAARAEIATAQGALAATRADLDAGRLALAREQAQLAAARQDAVRQGAALAEVKARLAYRETIVGWLRWPLARLRMYVRPAG